jgi:hypothetical protein
MINNTQSRENWLIDWDETARSQGRALYRQGTFVMMVSQSGQIVPSIYETEEQAKASFAEQSWPDSVGVLRWKKE